MIPDNLDELIDDLSGYKQINQDTARYLKHIEEKLYKDIATRKRIDSGLLFLSCQIGASSISWLLFIAQVNISFVCFISALISLTPGLVDIGESFRFELSSERWVVQHNKPLIALTKLGIGIATTWNSNRIINNEIWSTNDQIQQTYQEIQKDNSNVNIKNSIPWQEVLAIALIGLIAVMFFKKIINSQVSNNVSKE